LTIAAANGAKVHPTAAGQLLTQPSDSVRFLLLTDGNTGQLNGVGAIAITNLQQRSTSHLKHFSCRGWCNSTTQQ
jgi:hypothetical protein